MTSYAQAVETNLKYKFRNDPIISRELTPFFEKLGQSAGQM